MLDSSLEVGAFVIEDGYVRFLDRAVKPAYSETVSRLALRVENLSSTPGTRAKLKSQAIVGGDEGLPGKPEPALFLEAARRVGAVPADCIVFEDAPFGIEAARRAGMRAVAICSSHPPEQLAGPHVLASVRDFRQLTTSNFLEKLDA